MWQLFGLLWLRTYRGTRYQFSHVRTDSYICVIACVQSEYHTQLANEFRQSLRSHSCTAVVHLSVLSLLVFTFNRSFYESYHISYPTVS